MYTFCRYVRLSKTKGMLLVRLYAMQPASQLNQAIYITRFKDSTHQIHNSNNHHWWMVLGKKEEKPYFESVKAPITTLLQAPHVYQKHTYILYAQREGSLAGWMGWWERMSENERYIERRRRWESESQKQQYTTRWLCRKLSKCVCSQNFCIHFDERSTNKTVIYT